MQPISRGRLLLALILAAAMTTAASALARLSQAPTWRPRIWVGGGRWYRTPPKWANRSQTGSTSVRGADSPNANVRGIADDLDA